MPIFVRLPSGLQINLALVNRVEWTEELGLRQAVVYFSGADSVTLASEDADALNRRLTSAPGLNSNVRTTVFWCVMLLTVFLLWLALSRRS